MAVGVSGRVTGRGHVGSRGVVTWVTGRMLPDRRGGGAGRTTGRRGRAAERGGRGDEGVGGRMRECVRENEERVYVRMFVCV